MESGVVSRRLGFHESLIKQRSLYFSWIFIIIVVMGVYTYIVGYESQFTRILGAILLFVLIANMVFSGLDGIAPYELEIKIYEYVEANARAMLPFGIALAALVLAAGSTNERLISTKFLLLLLLSTICFVAVLTIIWMPKDSGLPIRILRDIKTAILTLGGISVIALVGHFVEVFQQNRANRGF